MCSTTSRDFTAPCGANRRSDTSARLNSSAKLDSLNVASTDPAATHTLSYQSALRLRLFVVRQFETDQVFREERVWLISVQILSGLQSVLQATVCDGGKFDASAFCDDRLRSAVVDVRWRDVVDALMIAGVIVMLDEGSDLSFEISG
jgi:hypothetical protein